MTTTTISHLPRDMVEEILSRIPLKFMRTMRLTCKKWDTLSKNRSFTKMHLAKEETSSNSQMIVLMDDKPYITSVVVNGTDVDPHTERKGKLACLNDSEQVKIYQIFHCEGLLLCILRDTSRIVVWNPYWAQTRWIEPRYHYAIEIDGVIRYRYALGFSKNKKNRKSHKILRFIDDSFLLSRLHFLWYEIYDLDTGLWKTLDVTSPHWRIASFDLGVSLKGNTYWIASERNPTRTLEKHLICFDFTTERFGRLLPLPWPGCLRGGELATLSCVREEKLAALLKYEHDEGRMFEIWITTKIDPENVLWSKFLKVNNMETIAGIPISFRCGDFFVDEEKRLAMVFDKVSDKINRHTVNIIGEDGYFRQVEDGYFREVGLARASRESFWWRRKTVCSYVPSLVQLKQLSGGYKSKQQSNLERHRCDEKMSRFAAIDKQIKQEWERFLRRYSQANCS